MAGLHRLAGWIYETAHSYPSQGNCTFYSIFFSFFSFKKKNNNNIDNKTKFLNVFHQKQSVMIIWH